MNLYLVKTHSFRAYVIASGMDIAYKKFREVLDRRDYGYDRDRALSSVELIAKMNDDGFECPKSAEGSSYDDLCKDDLLLMVEE